MKLIAFTVQEEICKLSRETAPDVDGWISQARQLHADIERSRVTAREIVIQHEKGQQFRHQVAEATEKVQHLQDEIALNRTLSETVEEIRSLEHQLASAHEAVNDNQSHRSVELLQALENTLAATPLPPNSHALRILSSKCSDLRSSIGVGLKRQWDSFAQINHSAGQMTVTGIYPDIVTVLDYPFAANLDRRGSGCEEHIGRSIRFEIIRRRHRFFPTRLFIVYHRTCSHAQRRRPSNTGCGRKHASPRIAPLPFTAFRYSGCHHGGF